MRANIEFKAKVANAAVLHARIAALSPYEPTEFGHEDVFFVAPRGRLKLRIIDGQRGQLIYYERPNRAGPKRSQYSIAEVGDVAALRETLSMSLGITGIVQKRRALYELGRTRIHVDTVESLGVFVEVEVVLAANESEMSGRKLADDMLRDLRIGQADLVEGSYMDLLLQAASSHDDDAGSPPAR